MDSTGNRRPWSEGRTDSEVTQVAYSSIDGIEFLEPNDGTRLGYHVYRFLTGELSSVKVAVQEAKARTSMHPLELERTIAARLAAAGVPAA